MNKIAATILICLFLQGCATPYQKSGFRGGYSETFLDKNVFKVSFNGNSATDKERVSDFVLLRSAELTLENGYSYFVITDSKSNDSYYTHTTPVVINTHDRAHTYGRTSTGVSTTTMSGGETFTHYRPGLINTVVCYNKKPKDVFSYDAQFIKNKMSEKYNLFK